jgi:succinoglycan biosynthesis transport protein ExoP
VLFAVQWGVTPQETARSAVSLLRAAGADIAGAVLTRVNMRKHVRYNFGDVGRNYRQHRRYYLRSR